MHFLSIESKVLMDAKIYCTIAPLRIRILDNVQIQQMKVQNKILM